MMEAGIVPAHAGSVSVIMGNGNRVSGSRRVCDDVGHRQLVERNALRQQGSHRSEISTFGVYLLVCSAWVLFTWELLGQQSQLFTTPN